MTVLLQRAPGLLGLGFIGFVVLAAQAGCGASVEGRTDQEALRTLALFEQELEVIDLLLSASEAYPPRDHVIRHVNIVDPPTGEVRADMRVRVADGRIADVGPDRGDPAGAGAFEIDGTGRYLLPGLADMHIHQLTSASQHLLHVATGVTTVRDMVGFPWLIEWREKSDRDEWLAPSMIVAGPIISSRPMGMYAQVVEDEAAARELVREHAEAGFGGVAPGLRADLLLLGSHPLASLDALDDREGVMVRGRWLDRDALDGLLDRLAAIYDRVPEVARTESGPSAAWLETIEEEVRRLRAAGYVFPDHQLTEFREALAMPD